MALRDRRRQLGQHAGPVLHFHDQGRVVITRHRRIPPDRHPALGRLAQLGQVRAIQTVHHDALAGGVVAHDVVARNRLAAVGEADHAALAAIDQDLLLRMLRMRPTAQLGIRHQRLRGLVGHPVAQRHFGQQGLQAGVTVFGQERIQAPLRQALQRAVHRLQRAVEHAVAQLDRVFVLQLLELVADRGARLGTDHEFQPLRLGRGRARGDHFHRLAADQLGAQRHQFLVHARGHGHVAHIGMHRIGEIERGGVARQGQDLALRGKQVDLVREQVHLDVVQELQRRTGGALGIDQFHDPGMRTALRAVGRIATELVRPVRRHTALGDQVHLFGADLHLDRRTIRPEQHRVQ